MTANIKRLTAITLGVLALLLIPLIAMQFTTEVNWSLFDFSVAGALLLSAGLACNFILYKSSTKGKRILAIVGVLVVLALIWAELAVGIFGSPIAGS